MKFDSNSIHPESHMEIMWDCISKLSYQFSTSLAREQKIILQGLSKYHFFLKENREGR